MGKITTTVLTVLVSLLFVALVLAGGSIWYVTSPPGTSTQTSSFIVVKGDTVASIATKLADQGYLRKPLILRVLYKMNAGNQAIQPGTYKLSQSMSPQVILSTLLSDTQDAWVTLKEGWRSEEMAEEIAGSLHSTFSRTEFIVLAKPVEGKLFPDTYLLSKDMDAAAVFAKLTSTFEDKYAKAMTTEGPGVLPKAQTIVLASLVEREGRGDKDSRMVAGILKNRVDAGMPLQVDATLQYAKGYDSVKKTWWGVPKSADKDSTSPYNTYKFAGLPPGAICNPGLLSLEAALNPTPSEYLYYLHDTQGIPHYAKTYEEHQQNIEKYLR